MGHGIQVFDPSGHTIVDISSHLSALMASIHEVNSGAYGSFHDHAVPGFDPANPNHFAFITDHAGDFELSVSAGNIRVFYYPEFGYSDCTILVLK